MDKKAFAELVSSVQDMGRHMRGGKAAANDEAAVQDKMTLAE